jgi:hypothetical protein
VVTAADTAAGSVDDTATASAQDPAGGAVLSPVATLALPAGAPTVPGSLPNTGLPLRTLAIIGLLTALVGSTLLAATDPSLVRYVRAGRRG